MKRPTETVLTLSSWLDQRESGLFIFSCSNIGQSTKKTENRRSLAYNLWAHTYDKTGQKRLSSKQLGPLGIL